MRDGCAAVSMDKPQSLCAGGAADCLVRRHGEHMFGDMVDTLALPIGSLFQTGGYPGRGAGGEASAPTEPQNSLSEGIGFSLIGRSDYALERKFYHVATSRIRYVSER